MRLLPAFGFAVHMTSRHMLTFSYSVLFLRWGDAVQDGVRIPGARFKMDLTHARRPFGLPGFPFRGFKRE